MIWVPSSECIYAQTMSDNVRFCQIPREIYRSLFFHSDAAQIFTDKTGPRQRKQHSSEIFGRYLYFFQMADIIRYLQTVSDRVFTGGQPLLKVREASFLQEWILDAKLNEVIDQN